MVDSMLAVEPAAGELFSKLLRATSALYSSCCSAAFWPISAAGGATSRPSPCTPD